MIYTIVSKLSIMRIISIFNPILVFYIRIGYHLRLVDMLKNYFIAFFDKNYRSDLKFKIHAIIIIIIKSNFIAKEAYYKIIIRGVLGE